jgi:hypothetical protein
MRDLADSHATALELDNLAKVLRVCSALQGLPPGSVSDMCQHLQRQSVDPGHIIVSEGEQSLFWYIVLGGRAKIDVAHVSSIGSHLTVAELSPGMAFGEFGLIYDQARSATVRAADGGVVLGVLQLCDYKRILMDFHRRTIFAFFQQKIEFLQDWKLFHQFSRMSIYGGMYRSV